MATNAYAIDASTQEPQLAFSSSTATSPGRMDAAILIGLVAGLMMIGLLMAYSASATLAPQDETKAWYTSPTVRQLAFLAGGLTVMITTSFIPYQMWQWRKGPFLLQPAVMLVGVSLVLLALVFAPGIGVEMNGSRRWVKLGPASLGLNFQPSEAAKLAMVILLSAWFTSRRDGKPVARGLFSGIIPACMIIGICAGAVGAEDFGTAALMAMIGGMLLFCAGGRLIYLFLLVAPAAGAAWYLVTSKPYRLERLTMFRHIWEDPLEKGYHQVQSLCTIASGGWWGRGLGQGIQKYGYLPESRTDSIFAVICEELGFPGAVLVIGLFLALLWQGHRVIRHCDDPFGKLLATGFTLMLAFQAAMNIAVVTVSVPTKGISLPFVSAGGSGILFLSAMVGILANIARQRKAPIT